jgi:hypothetical protein
LYFALFLREEFFGWVFVAFVEIGFGKMGVGRAFVAERGLGSLARRGLGVRLWMTRRVGEPCFFAERGSLAREIGRLSGEVSGGFD